MSMVSNFGSSWCTLEEDNYLTLVEKDLVIFSKGRSVNRILVFPPLAARFRFLTHKLIERWPEFESYSVGSEPYRRTIVYFQEYKAEIHKRTQKSMNTSKQETGQAPQSSTHGSGKGHKIRGQGQHDSRGNSPTSSRRSTQVFYTPGAFSKQRKHPESQAATSAETSGNVRGTIRKSVTETKFLKGNDKSIMSLKHNNKSDARSPLECKSDSKNNRNITENMDTLEHSLDKLHVCSPATYSAQNTLKTENKKKDSMSAGYAGKETDNGDAFSIHESQLCCIDSTVDHFTNSLPSTDSKQKSIECYDNNIPSKLNEGNYRNQEVSAEDSTLHIENTSDNENIQCNNHKKSNGCGSIKKPIEIDMPTAVCNEFATSFVEQGDSESYPEEKRVSKKTNDGKIMVNEELILNMDKDAIESNGKVSDNIILSSKRSDVVREDVPDPSETLSYLKDENDKIEVGNIESIVDSINNEKIEVQSKSKRQCKKEMKAKKKEGKIKKKQIKPKSERTTKKCDGEETAAAEENKVHDLGKKGKDNKLPKTEQGKEDMIPDDKMKKNDKYVVDSSPVDFRVDCEGSDSKMENERDSAEDEDWERTWDDDGECLDEDHLV